MVYDCFIFFNELDLLEIRLNELDEVVDYFVLVEANRTFQNNHKPYYFDENKERFSQFLPKIIHIKLDKYPLFIPIFNPFTPWKLEIYQRNSILQGLKNCEKEDIILISDVDEIPKASLIKETISNGINQIYGLKMSMFLYYFNNQLIYDAGTLLSIDEAKDGIWHCSALLPFKLLKKKPQKIRKTIMRTIRRKEVYKILPDAGWHFTYIGGVQKIIEKLEAFSHSEFNNEEFKNKEKIEQQLKSGHDVLGRDVKFNVLTDLSSLPKYLQKESTLEKFKDYFIQK